MIPENGLAVDQQIPEFQADLEQHLQRFFEQLQMLRDSLKLEATQRRSVESAFRTVHSIKGAASSGDLKQVVSIAHQVEELLAEIRGGRLRLNQRLVRALEDGGNLLTACLSPEPPSDSALEAFKCDVVEVLHQSEVTEDLLTELPRAASVGLTEDQKLLTRRLLNTGAQLYEVCTSFDVAQIESELSRLKKALEELGEVVSTQPSLERDRPDEVSFRLLFVSREDLATLRDAIKGFGTLSLSKLTQPYSIPLTSGETEASVRLPVSEIERVAQPLEELFTLVRRSLQWAIDKTDGSSQKKFTEDLGAVENAIDSIKAELTELRLIPASQILERAARSGRAAARSCKKEVHVKVVGGDVRIDRVAEAAIADCLVHLVRNAVDHGIESPEERAAAGKQLPAIVRIEAETDEGDICLRVSDDGRGIDFQAVSKAAATFGYSSIKTALTLDECLQLIFEPGVSTKETSSETSGRGVGLDVVRQSVASIGGEVRVQTEKGKGSTFEVRIPRPPSNEGSVPATGGY